MAAPATRGSTAAPAATGTTPPGCRSPSTRCGSSASPGVRRRASSACARRRWARSSSDKSGSGLGQGSEREGGACTPSRAGDRMRFRVRTLLALLVLLALAGCGSDDSSGGGGGGGAKKSVIYVSTNPLGTNQFLNLIADGAKPGGKQCGASVKVIQSNDPTQLAANLRAAVQAKPALIVANSFDSVETISGLIKQAPDQKWALVDGSVDKAPNLRGILFKENEGMYLIGAAYALLAKGDEGGGFPASKSVGFVGAIDNALVRRWYNGYAQGVKDTNAGERVLSGWGNSFNDPATSKEVALSENGK